MVADAIDLDAAVQWGRCRRHRRGLGKSVSDVVLRAVAADAMCLAAVGEDQLEPDTVSALGIDLLVSDPMRTPRPPCWPVV